MGSYDVRDLVRAHVDAERFANAHPDLAASRSGRFQAMARAFGINEPETDRGGMALPSLERSAIGAILGLRSPFSGYLEAPVEIHQLHAEYSARINDGIAEATTAIEDLLVEIASRRHQIPASRTVSDDELTAGGFDVSRPWPDELDYW